MKEASRNKFMLCFRPIEHVDSERSVRYISARNDGGTAKSSAVCSAGPIQCARKRSLSRVLYHSIWGKRARDKKGSRSSTRTSSLTSEESLTSSSSSYASSSDDNKTEDLQNQETKPNPVSESRIGTSQSHVSSGALLFLISLATTVLWGRLFATLFTSIWIYFLTPSKGVAGDRSSDSPAATETATRSKKTMSAERYSRKRVIMEGLLDRNHRRPEIQRI